MKVTDRELMTLADAAEHWSETADLDAERVDRLEDLAAVGAAAEARDHADATLASRVAVARSHGRSWTEIAVRLGVSRQAARQKYSPLVHDVKDGSITARRLVEVHARRSQVEAAEEVGRDPAL